MKSKQIYLICILLMSFISYPVFAQDSQYVVKDLISDTVVATASTISQANIVYEENKQLYEELAILQDERIIDVEYGILSIPIDSEGCTYNYEFTNDITKQAGYVNGCYGKDALFLGMNDSKTSVKFMISGAVGWGDAEDITIIPYSKINQLTSYVVIDENLYHQVKTDLNSDKYNSLINLGNAPEYLEENKIYLSYDGHYFYDEDQFREMSDDARSNTFTSSINEYDPFFNYYQYVTHRTISNVSEDMLKEYLRDELKISESISNYNDQNKDSIHDVLTQSQYYNYETSFHQNQNRFGSNALMMLALSMNESATGRSSLAYTRNNLFGHAAYDSDVEKNASRYYNVFNSVYSHAKNYISKSYLNPDKFQYHGGYFGDKASGMNVSYASDPYWGEKAAQHYYQLDEQFAFADLNSVALAIKTSNKNISIFDENNEVLYRSGNNPYMSFVVLDETDEMFKIQIDPVIYDDFNDEGSYDFQKNVGYIFKDEIDVLYNEDKISENEYITVTLDANGGYFYNGEATLSYQVKKGDKISVEIPLKENAIFDDWNEEVSYAENNNTYVANYKEIESINMHTLPPTILEYYDRIDLTGGSIEVVYKNKETEIIELNSSMVSGYIVNEVGFQDVVVSYGGAKTSYVLEVSMELEEERLLILDLISQVFENLNKEGEFIEEDFNLLEKLNSHFLSYGVPYMTFNETRALDEIFYNALKDDLHTVISKNEVNLALSGLYLHADYTEVTKDKFIKDTIRISYEDAKGSELVKDVSSANNLEVVHSFKLNGKYNFDDLRLNDYVLVSLDIPEGISSNQIIQVLQESDGHVIKLSTIQTENKLVFKTNEFSTFTITTRNSVNEYNSEDVVETVYFENNGFNIYAVMSTLFIVLVVSILSIILILYSKKKFK